MCATDRKRRILGHVHTFNDDDVIDRSLGALLAQTRPLDAIVIVDNGSTDRTLARSFPPQVTVIRHGENLGTSGAVVSGMRFALEHGFDWIWVFDADSVPHKDALERLLALYDGFPEAVQAETRVLASMTVDAADGRLGYGVVFTPRGWYPARPRAGEAYHEFDAGIWTGCLFKVDAIRRVGLPPLDYVLDWGEFEYGYRGKRSGLRAFMHQSSLVDHNVGGQASMLFREYRVGPISVRMFELPPIRCYYTIRNAIYFWVYAYERWSLRSLARCFGLVGYVTLNFLLRPRHHGREITACVRALWDGLTARMDRRY